ncbi:MAG: 30S ribosomal protein S20 [Myxococcales bacterium]|nr:30S ribosomal protein S20 [Myxococcales bacterium]|tara:strand:- start:816 stop:1076 length:261 start_codon:yes stop_codon:yes gene_type:complete
MANHKSALKRNRQNIKRREANRVLRSGMRTQLKKAREEIQKGGADWKEGEVKAAVRSLAAMAQKGILKRTTASRRISRLMKAANAS